MYNGTSHQKWKVDIPLIQRIFIFTVPMYIIKKRKLKILYKKMVTVSSNTFVQSLTHDTNINDTKKS